MKKKEPMNTGPPNDSEVPKKRFFGSKKDTTNKSSAKQFEASLPEIAKKYNIRVSNPYGYYPEDVEKVLADLDSQLKMLQKENDHLIKQLEDSKQNVISVQNELTALKMQISLMDVPDTSAEENFAMLSRIGTITGKNEDQILQNKVVKIPTKTQPTINVVRSNNVDTTKPTVDKKRGPSVINLNFKKGGL